MAVTILKSNNNHSMVAVYRKQAHDCKGVIRELEKVRTWDPAFFLSTGGEEQLEIYRNEYNERMQMADELEKSL